jgi:hypothetical protein
MAMLKSIMLSMEGGRARNDFSLALAIQEQHCGDHKERSNRTAWHCSSPPPEYPIMDRGIARSDAQTNLIVLPQLEQSAIQLAKYGISYDIAKAEEAMNVRWGGW